MYKAYVKNIIHILQRVENIQVKVESNSNDITDISSLYLYFKSFRENYFPSPPLFFIFQFFFVPSFFIRALSKPTKETNIAY